MGVWTEQCRLQFIPAHGKTWVRKTQGTQVLSVVSGVVAFLPSSGHPGSFGVCFGSSDEQTECKSSVVGLEGPFLSPPTNPGGCRVAVPSSVRAAGWGKCTWASLEALPSSHLINSKTRMNGHDLYPGFLWREEGPKELISKRTVYADIWVHPLLRQWPKPGAHVLNSAPPVIACGWRKDADKQDPHLVLTCVCLTYEVSIKIFTKTTCKGKKGTNAQREMVDGNYLQSV